MGLEAGQGTQTKMDSSHQLERELIEKAQTHLHAKIDAGEFNGDVDENMLLVLLSINRRVGRICSNPLVVIGDYFQKFPKMVVPSMLVLWILIGASAALALLGFAEATGISVHLP